MAFRRSLAEQGGGGRDAEEQLRAALAASLEVWAPAIILSSHWVNCNVTWLLSTQSPRHERPH